MRTLILASLAIAAALPLAAQNTVRWQVDGGYRYATLEFAEGDLIVVSDDATRVLSREALASLQVRGGGSRSRGYNALMGAGVGGAIGGVLGLTAATMTSNCRACMIEIKPLEGLFALSGLGAAAGALIGAVLVPASHWTPWGRSAQGGAIRPVAGMTATGDPRLGVRVAF